MQGNDGWVPGGYLPYVLTEDVPGKSLLTFSGFPLPKRDEVRIAFAKA